MKRILNGKLYDTTKSILIGHAICLYAKDHDCWLQERLFITQKGAFFLEGIGARMTHWNGREGIRDINKETALQWCEHHEVATTIIQQYFEITEA